MTLAFQCVELLCSDYLYMLPKAHIPKALGVLALYAQQVEGLNVVFYLLQFLLVLRVLCNTLPLSFPFCDSSFHDDATFPMVLHAFASTTHAPMLKPSRPLHCMWWRV